MTRETSEAANGAQPQVFISYGGADAERVLKIVRLLEAEGITVWHHGDRTLGGQLWDEEIAHAIDHSRVVMLMCSPHSFQSDNVRREVLVTWEYAHRRYVPVCISPPMEIPLRFRFCLAGCQWIDAHSQPQEQWLPQLLKALQAQGIDTKNKLVRAVEPTPAPGPGTSEHFGATRGFRRWVAVGAIGLVEGVFGVILYFATDNGTVNVRNEPTPPKPAIAAPPAPEPMAGLKAAVKDISPVPAPHDPDYITTRTGQIKLRLIPAGEFLMGSRADDADDEDAFDDEKPQHPVRITQWFYLGVNEVTQAQYEAVMGNDPSYFSATGAGKDKVAGQSTDRHPVEDVSWLDAVNFCNKLSDKEGLKPFYEIDGDGIRVADWSRPGYRLPTEAEWEYACRANAPTRYSFGKDASSLGEFAWYNGNSGSKTRPVGEKRPNGFGLFDMHGNVWEWCWDGGDAYKASRVDDPTGLDGAAFRVIRSGSWVNDARFMRAAFRDAYGPSVRSFNVGFRCARVQSRR